MEQVQHRESPRPEPDDAHTPPVVAAPQVADQQLDDLLDEIDDLIESNAEVFVRGFVQKGGQ